MKRLSAVALLLILVSGIGLAVPAWSVRAGQPPGLKMEVEAAFDGYFKYGEWLPVRVELQNDGPDLDAEVRVRVPGDWGATTYAVPAPLPSGSHKLIPVYVLPNNFTHVLEVELEADGEVLLSQRVPVKPQPNINYLVGVVAPERGAISFVSGASLPGQERPKTLIDLSLGELPERPEGLRSIDTLILNDTDTSSLTPQQKTALETWVGQGGHLVVGGGAGALRTAAGLPSSLLPLVPRGEVELEAIPALADFAGADPIRVPGPFVVATGDDQEGRTLVAQDGLPLVRERAVGAGSVDSAALDLATSPFDAWTGTTAFWERLLSPNAAYPDWLPPDMSARQMKAGSMTYALSRLPTLDLPSIRGLGLLLVLYIVLVGPVNYLVLRRFKRLHWGWVSVPLITLMFTAGAFGLGYALRGTDLIVNKIAIVELGSDGVGRVTSYLGLFSPRRQSYEIDVEGGGLLSPLSPAYDPWGANRFETGGEIVFVQGEPSQVRGLTVNQWSMQNFMAESDWAEAGHIRADLEFVDETVVGTVRNEMPYTLKDTALILGNHFVRMGDLSSGQETPVTLDLTNPSDRGFGQPLSYLLFEDEMMQTGSGGPPRDAELKRLVIENAFGQGGGMSPISSRMPWGAGGDTPRMLTFIGWLDDAPPYVKVAAPPQMKMAGRTPGQQTTALLYAPLSYDLPDSGEISLPPGLIPGALTQLPVEGGTCGPNATSVWMGRGTASFEFRIPEEAHDIQVDQIKLAIRTDGGGWWDPPQTAVYDWASDEWPVLADPVIGVNVLSDAGNMVSEDGLVRVRLSADSNQGGCLYLELGLEGRR